MYVRRLSVEMTKYLIEKNVEEEQFSLALSFKGHSPWLLSSISFRFWVRQAPLHHGGQESKRELGKGTGVERCSSWKQPHSDLLPPVPPELVVNSKID